MPSSEKLKISDVPKKFPYFVTKRPLYYTEHKVSTRNDLAQWAWLGLLAELSGLTTETLIPSFQ